MSQKSTHQKDDNEKLIKFKLGYIYYYLFLLPWMIYVIRTDLVFGSIGCKYIVTWSAERCRTDFPDISGVPSYLVLPLVAANLVAMLVDVWLCLLLFNNAGLS